jgi:hypothetical protein
MYDLKNIPVQTYQDFNYVVISELDSELRVWITPCPRARAHDIGLQNDAERLWISPLTPTPEAEVYELHGFLMASGARHSGDTYKDVSFETAVKHIEETGWGLGLLFYNQPTNVPEEV